MHGKIIKGIAGFYYVHAEDGEVYECKAKGSFRSRNVKPLVGDNAEIEADTESSAIGARESVLGREVFRTGIITDILPRKNCLIRPSCANVDQALVIFASAQPEPNLNLLDKFLVMMDSKKIPTIICFNKNDLVDGQRRAALSEIYQNCGYETISISVKNNDGVDRVKELLKGKTTVLAGPSGVGKSSFINQAAPGAGMETGALSEKIQRGRHTTRHSELFLSDRDSYIMDTPGFTSLYLEDIECRDLKSYFHEFEKYEDECRFQGCIHIGEKQCGVKDALARGEIASSRYENYKLIYEELKNNKRY